MIKSPCIEMAFLLSGLCVSLTGTTLRPTGETEAELRARRLKKRSTRGGTLPDTPGESGAPDVNCRLRGPESRRGSNQGKWIIHLTFFFCQTSFYSSCPLLTVCPASFPCEAHGKDQVLVLT